MTGKWGRCEEGKKVRIMGTVYGQAVLTDTADPGGSGSGHDDGKAGPKGEDGWAGGGRGSDGAARSSLRGVRAHTHTGEKPVWQGYNMLFPELMSSQKIPIERRVLILE